MRHRDPYTVEREQRQQDRVLGGCVIAIIILFGVMLACGGCTARRSASAAVTATHSDSASLAVTAVTQATWQGAATWSRAADSLAVTITADSLTAPDGTRLHRPAITLTSRNPRAVAAAAHEGAQASTVTLAAIRAASDSTTTVTATQTAATAVYDPPDTGDLIGAILLFAMVLAELFIIIRAVSKAVRDSGNNP